MIPLCLLSGKPMRLEGSETLLSRPLSDVARKAEESRAALTAVFSRENFTRTVSGILRRLDAASEDRNAPERP